MAGRIASDNIQELSRCEVFVFGSNLEGQHFGGAARIAYEKFGAEWGVRVSPKQGIALLRPKTHRISINDLSK